LKKHRALGRGLEALIPVAARREPALEGVRVTECPIEQLVANDHQPRQRFDEQKLRELAGSIKAKGILQPLLVRKKGDKFEILAGERRWRAARIAGLNTVPVVVKEFNNTEAIEVALVENLQREDLNPLEEAEAYRQLTTEHGLSQEELARRVGKDRSTVANTLRLLKLPQAVQQELLQGNISMGHARAILALPNEESQLRLARRVVAERLTVRECERLAQPAAGGKKSPAKRHKSPDELRLVEGLQRRLGTKVELFAGPKRGRLVIHYYSNEQLDNIIRLIEGR
jgi:ParB family chromosome partitioning protein